MLNDTARIGAESDGSHEGLCATAAELQAGEGGGGGHEDDSDQRHARGQAGGGGADSPGLAPSLTCRHSVNPSFPPHSRSARSATVYTVTNILSS